MTVASTKGIIAWKKYDVFYCMRESNSRPEVGLWAYTCQKVDDVNKSVGHIEPQLTFHGSNELEVLSSEVLACPNVEVGVTRLVLL
jgi:hypothetical protein